MKKLTKIVLGVILSVAMVVTGGLAFSNLNNAYANTSLQVNGLGTVSTESEEASINVGTYAQVRRSSSKFTGIRLTGKTGATFNLGTVDIAKSDWAGGYTEVKAPYVDENGVSHENNSFFEFVFDMHDTNEETPTTSANGGVGKTEMDSVTITFKQGDKSMILLVSTYPYYNSPTSTTASLEFTATARASVQTDGVGGFRNSSSYTTLIGSPRKGRILSDDRAKLGYGTGGDLAVNANSGSQVAIPFYYDFNDVALYTPAVCINTASGLNDNFLIRDFNSNEAKYNSRNSSVTAVWNGFTKNANGEALVDVSVTFGTVNGDSPSSIVITKLGNDYVGNVISDVEDAKVINVADANGSAKFGTYAQSVSGKEYTGINLTGATGATFNLGTMSINDTYFDKNWSYVKGTGIVNSKVSGAEYTGTNFVYAGTNADTRSFIDFVINPNSTGITLGNWSELFTITLREIDNEETTDVDESENFITYHMCIYVGDGVVEGQIICSATNNVAAHERFYKDGIKTGLKGSGIQVRRQLDISGSQPKPISLYYDAEQNAAYTNYAYSNVDGIYNAFRIRDFNAVTENESDYAVIDAGIESWDGFSENANVEVTLTMSEMYNTSTLQNSVIITSLFGYKFYDVELDTVDEVTYFAGEDYDLGKAVINNTKSISYQVNGVGLNTLKYKVNGADSERIATTLNSGDVVTVHDANGNQVGNDVTVSIVPLQSKIIANNGTYEVYRENALVEDGSIKDGDEIRFTPGYEEVSNLYLSDLRRITIGETTYEFNEANSLVTVNKTGENVNYYSYIVDGDCVVNGVEAVVSATFDRYCDITVTDSEKGTSETEYHWAVDGNFTFPYDTVGNADIIRRGASTDKVLMGYARTDVAEKKADGTFENKRSDYTVADYNKKNATLMHYNSRGLGNSYYANSEIKDMKSVASIVPGVTFEAVYVKIWIDVEIKLTSGYTDEYSGLRFVVKFDKNDMDNYLSYFADSAKENNNPFNVIFNYVTTQDELDAGGKNITYDKINSTHWRNGTWNSATTANNLGLYNGTDKSASEMENKPGYIFKQFVEGEDIWHYEFDEEDGVYAYAITITGIDKNNNQNKEYIFMPLIRVVEICGSSTSFVVNAVKATPSVVAGEKLTEVLKTEDFTGYNYKMKDQNGAIYYSKYTAADMNWLAGMAGDDREFENVNA